MSKINCPYHLDDTASMELYDSYAHCFGCSAHVKLEDLGLTPLTESRPRYVEDVKSRIKEIECLPTAKIRGFDLHNDRLSYFILWPDKSYYLERIKDPAPGQPKYRCPSGVERPLFKYDAYTFNSVIIVEGELNAMSIRAALPSMNVVSPGPSVKFYSKTVKKNLPYYGKFHKISIIADKDGAGVKAAIELKAYLLDYTPYITIYLMKDDANSVLVDYGKDRLKEELKANLDLPEGL